SNSPSQRATTVATDRSAVTFTQVRVMSSGLSNGRMNPITTAICSGVMPIAPMTAAIRNMEAPGTAAVPTDTSAVTPIMIRYWARPRSTPKACAANTETIPTYSAVPSMLIVAPSGITVVATTGLTPRFFSATDMVTGMVAELDDVENATSIASRAPRKNRTGDTLATNFISVLCTSTMCSTQ